MAFGCEDLNMSPEFENVCAELRRKHGNSDGTISITLSNLCTTGYLRYNGKRYPGKSTLAVDVKTAECLLREGLATVSAKI